MRPGFALIIGVVMGYFIGRVVFSFQEYEINSELDKRYQECRQERNQYEHQFNLCRFLYKKGCE